MQFDIIFIQGLRVQTIVGIYEWEKQFKQPLIFDLELATNLKSAAESDKIEDTVDYKQISDEIIEMVEGNQFELLETIGESICAHILKKHATVLKVQLKIHKPNAVPQAETVGIQIVRGR